MIYCCGNWIPFTGLEAYPLKLLASYLQGRQQYTVVGDYRSPMLEITQGVPQGSSLGPLLFALNVNDLPKASAFNSTLFADDTVLSISSGNCIELQKLVNTESQKVDAWMRFNKLSLNYSKTSYMKTISRSVGIFYRIRHYLNERALKSLYFSIVFSHLQYAIGA